MKIRKASNTPLDNEVVANVSDPVTEIANIDYAHAAAIEYINKAISALGKVATQDVVAKESIANLSVVLLDLQ